MSQGVWRQACPGFGIRRWVPIRALEVLLYAIPQTRSPRIGRGGFSDNPIMHNASGAASEVSRASERRALPRLPGHPLADPERIMVFFPCRRAGELPQGGRGDSAGWGSKWHSTPCGSEGMPGVAGCRDGQCVSGKWAVRVVVERGIWLRCGMAGRGHNATLARRGHMAGPRRVSIIQHN